MRPYSHSAAEWPTVIVLAIAGLLVALAYAPGCTVHEDPIGHRIDQPPVLVVTPSKADDDGGHR